MKKIYCAIFTFIDLGLLFSSAIEASLECNYWQHHDFTNFWVMKTYTCEYTTTRAHIILKLHRRISFLNYTGAYHSYARRTSRIKRRCMYVEVRDRFVWKNFIRFQPRNTRAHTQHIQHRHHTHVMFQYTHTTHTHTHTHTYKKNTTHCINTPTPEPLTTHRTHSSL